MEFDNWIKITFHHDFPVIEGRNVSIVVLAHFDDDFEENSIAVEEEMTFLEVEAIESVGILYQPHIFHHGRCCEEDSSEVGVICFLKEEISRTWMSSLMVSSSSNRVRSPLSLTNKTKVNNLYCGRYKLIGELVKDPIN